MNEDKLNNISYIQKEDDLQKEDTLKKGDNLKDKDNFKMFVQFGTANSKFIPRPEYISFHWWECLHKHIVQLYPSPRSQYHLKHCHQSAVIIIIPGQLAWVSQTLGRPQ